MSETHRAEFDFKVRSYVSGTPWIYAEPFRGELPLPKDAVLGLDLKEGTTVEEALEIERLLNDKVRFVSLTVGDP